MKKYLSIDIGGTNVKYALLDKAGKIVTEEKVPTAKTKDEFLSDLDKIIAQNVDEDLAGIAFCCPGKIEGTVISFGGALPFLNGIDFGKRYEKYNLPIAAINDGKASVLAENWLGSLQDLSDCASLTLGTGIGGGIIIAGKLMNGHHFQAGELSFMQISQNQENYSSYAGMSGSAVGMITTVNKILGNKDVTDGLAAFEAINNQDKRVMPTFENFCRVVAQTVFNLQTVADLEKIAIGGGISAQPVVVEGINQAYDQFLKDNPMIAATLTRPKIVAAKFRNKANLYGALYNLLLKLNNESL